MSESFIYDYMYHIEIHFIWSRCKFLWIPKRRKYLVSFCPRESLVQLIFIWICYRLYFQEFIDLKMLHFLSSETRDVGYLKQA